MAEKRAAPPSSAFIALFPHKLGGGCSASDPLALLLGSRVHSVSPRTRSKCAAQHSQRVLCLMRSCVATPMYSPCTNTRNLGSAKSIVSSHHSMPPSSAVAMVKVVFTRVLVCGSTGRDDTSFTWPCGFLFCGDACPGVAEVEVAEVEVTDVNGIILLHGCQKKREGGSGRREA